MTKEINMTNSLRSRISLSAGIFALALMAGGAAGTSAAHAEGAWCADAGGRNAYTNCGYYTYQQCRAAVSGVGGFCRQNTTFAPNYGYYDERPQRRARPHYR